MSTTVTSKGQVTIPKPIREYFGLKEGSQVDFEYTADGQVNLRPVKSYPEEKGRESFCGAQEHRQAPRHEHGQIHEPNPRLRSRRGRSRLQKPQVILVDSSVLIDVIDEARHWCGWSLAALDEWSGRGPVLINPVIYAEISPDFDHPAALDAVLEKVGIA